MRTIAESVSSDATCIKEDIRILLGQHSAISPLPEHDSIMFINPYGDQYWDELDVDGRRLQAKILRRYNTFRDFVHAMIRGLTDESQRQFEDADSFIRRHVAQECPTWCKTVAEAMEKTLAAFNVIEAIVDRLYSSDGASIVVPDTNALLASPHIDRWAFDWCASFEIVFTPTVLHELDELKVMHRNPDLRLKAEGVIRRIKELGRRGDLHAGVPVVKGRITARSVATEPNVGESLPWLDATNNDDRILASIVELARANTRSVVAIVTSDINLQNKARFARMCFCEPPSADRTVLRTEPPCR